MELGRGLVRGVRHWAETEEEVCGLFFNEIPPHIWWPGAASVTSLLFVFIALRPLWDMYAEYIVLGKKERKLVIAFPLLLHTPINITQHIHTKRNQSSRGVTVDISVNTSNCLAARGLWSVNPAWQSLLLSAWLRAWCFISSSGFCSCQDYVDGEKTVPVPGAKLVLWVPIIIWGFVSFYFVHFLFIFNVWLLSINMFRWSREMRGPPVNLGVDTHTPPDCA